MQGPDRAMAKRLHAIIKASAPARSPKTLVRDARVWPTSFALTELTPTNEARIGALVKKAMS
jgi:hypothetical protein